MRDALPQRIAVCQAILKFLKMNPNCKDSKKEKKKRSVVWNHFDVVDTENGSIKIANCKYCQATYKCSENGKNLGTKNLKDHLAEKHRDVQLNLKGKNTSGFMFSQDNYRAALLNWIIACDQPFTAPQQKTFLEIVNSLNPNAKTVSSATLKRDLMAKYSEKFELVKSKVLEIPGKISFTMDGWTSKNIFPFVNVRAHWVDINWEPQSVLLEFSEIQGDHSGANLSTIFLKCLSRYEISVSRILAITLDNASNNDTFVTSFQNELVKQGVDISSVDIQVRCLAHIMNLSVQDILASLKCTDDNNVDKNVGNSSNKYNDQNCGSYDNNEEDEEDNTNQKNPPSNSIVAKLRSPIKTIRKSPKMRQALKETCKSFGTKYKVPIIDVKTRWNSCYQMIDRAFELKDPLNDFCTKTFPLYLITSKEWDDLNTIRGLLQKFDRATKFISMERHTTISAYLPTLYWLIDSLEAFIKLNSGSVVVAAKAGLAKLRKYEDIMGCSKIALIALFLNPALKLEYFREHNYTKASIKDIEKMIHKVWKDCYEHISLSDNGKADDDFLAHICKRPKREGSLNEFQKYMRYPLSSPKVDVLKYWTTQENEFPSLTNMARDYLGAQTTSVPVERDFSGGVDLVTSTRCSLKPETVQAFMCLKSWLKNQI